MKTTAPNWWMLAIFLLASFSGSLFAGLLQPVSVCDPSLGPLPGGSGNSSTPIITPDGRYVVFASTAANLVLTTNNSPIPSFLFARYNVFLRDRTNQTTTLVSVNLTGAAGGNGDSLPTGISDDGRYVLFESNASDLVANDTNGVTDIFVRDLLVGTNILVSAATNGLPGNGTCRGSVMTPDGHYVAFVSAATNLIAGDTNLIADIFVRDLQLSTTVLASVGAKSTNAFLSASESPEISADGRYVAFYSTATNLVPGVSTVGEIYLRDLLNNTTLQVSAGAHTALNSASVVSFGHALSADGKFVAYEAALTSGSVYHGTILRYGVDSGLTDLVHTNATLPTGPYEKIRTLDLTPDGRFIALIANTNETHGLTTCIHVWDAQTTALTLASGNLTNGVISNSICDWPAIDATGRYVAFVSSAPGLTTNSLSGYYSYLRDLQLGATSVARDASGAALPSTLGDIVRVGSNANVVVFQSPDQNLNDNIYLNDRSAGATEIISAHDPTLPSSTANGPSFLTMSSVSDDRRYVAFASDASNLALNDTNRCRDVFVRDLSTGVNTLISATTNGFSGSGISLDPAISADGHYAAFTSTSTNLVANDHSKTQDVYVCYLPTRRLTLGSVTTNGTAGGNGDSFSPLLSADGTFLLFRSKAANVATGTFTAGTENLFLRNLHASNTIALTTGGLCNLAAGGGLTTDVAMTPDGRFIAFAGKIAGSSVTNLYVWDTLAAARVYTNTADTSWILSISPDGNRLAYASGSSSQLKILDRRTNTTYTAGTLFAASRYGFHFSDDGRFLVYAGSLRDIYLYDFQTHASTLVSHAYNSISTAGSGISDYPDISADGNYVVYRSLASNIVAGAYNSVPNIYLYDRVHNINLLLTASIYNQFYTNQSPLFSPTNSISSTGNQRSYFPVFSGDGHSLVFSSWASELSAGDFNRLGDLFSAGLLYPSLTPATSPAQGFVFSWLAFPGLIYNVQYKDDLQDSAWFQLTTGLTFDGYIATKIDSNPAAQHRFYRVSSPVLP